MSREEAMNKAVEECIRQNILKSFLTNNAKEVVNMLITEWNMDEALKVRAEEGRQEGMQKGMQEGMQKGMQKMLDLMKKGISVSEIEKMFSSTLRVN